MRNYLKYAVVLILAVALLALGGISCSSGGGGGATPTPASPYKVGALFATTGSGANLGQPEIDTVNMMVEQINAAGGINGHPLEVVFYNTESDTAR